MVGLDSSVVTHFTRQCWPKRGSLHMADCAMRYTPPLVATEVFVQWARVLNRHHTKNVEECSPKAMHGTSKRSNVVSSEQATGAGC